jgi:transcription elongation factor SPT6
VSSSALQEAHELFGDVDELLARRMKDLERAAANSSELAGNSLEDKFDPEILTDMYKTPRDEKIRRTDVPERMQVITS